MTILATVSTLKCQAAKCRATVSGAPTAGNRAAHRSAARAAQIAGWQQDGPDWLCPDHVRRDIVRGKRLVERAKVAGMFAQDPEDF